jgi:hypothetical protein
MLRSVTKRLCEIREHQNVGVHHSEAVPQLARTQGWTRVIQGLPKLNGERQRIPLAHSNIEKTDAEKQLVVHEKGKDLSRPLIRETKAEDEASKITLHKHHPANSSTTITKVTARSHAVHEARTSFRHKNVSHSGTFSTKGLQ